ncbi:MAG: hypothetical protein LBV64_01600 [Mediterranea sp.]|jgi:hypothetical protein|nr:hypothetical protein [Mediterranea sp.]
MKKSSFIILYFLAIVGIIACEKGDDKERQTIDFDNIPPQNITDGSVLLTATASSGLPVILLSSDTSIAIMEGNKAVFQKPGRIGIVASQPGNEQFYEAPNVIRELNILNRDPNKKDQTITFASLPSQWRGMTQGILKLNATASSGLPVTFTCDNTRLGNVYEDSYIMSHLSSNAVAYVTITASQEGNDEYNPALNVSQIIYAIHEATREP